MLPLTRCSAARIPIMMPVLVVAEILTIDASRVVSSLIIDSVQPCRVGNAGCIIGHFITLAFIGNGLIHIKIMYRLKIVISRRCYTVCRMIVFDK